MTKLLLLCTAIICVHLSSCNPPAKYSYTIDDFPRELQPRLIHLLDNGIVTWDSEFEKRATDEDLKRLSHSVYPVLRGVALIEMMSRESFKVDVIMDHLDDTAFVPVDEGEFGMAFRRVSDNVLERFNWPSEEAKEKAIDVVLTKHYYLSWAFSVLEEIKPKEKYYHRIKAMATQPRRVEDEMEVGFKDIESALYGLAAFKKREDIPIIKEKLLENFWRLNTMAFKLMSEFPDTSYREVLQKYHKNRFYASLQRDTDGFTGGYDLGARPEEFIEALAVQPDEFSVRIFDTILQRLPHVDCAADKGTVEDKVVRTVVKNKSEVYKRLREKAISIHKAKWNSIVIERKKSGYILPDPLY